MKILFFTIIGFIADIIVLLVHSLVGLYLYNLFLLPLIGISLGFPLIAGIMLLISLATYQSPVITHLTDKQKIEWAATGFINSMFIAGWIALWGTIFSSFL